jgi:hypothetical protein
MDDALHQNSSLCVASLQRELESLQQLPTDDNGLRESGRAQAA